MYTKKQTEIIKYTLVKVQDFMNARILLEGHNADHAARVANWAVQIAKAEKANIFLCELAGLLHDVGRAREHEIGNTSVTTSCLMRFVKIGLEMI